MSKEHAIEMLMLLSALESWSFSAKVTLPDYLHEKLLHQVEVLRLLALQP